MDDMRAEIVHSRKGTFIGDVTDVCETWVDVEILEGTAKYICPWNDNAVPGDVIRIRKSLCIITPLESDADQ